MVSGCPGLNTKNLGQNEKADGLGTLSNGRTSVSNRLFVVQSFSPIRVTMRASITGESPTMMNSRPPGFRESTKRVSNTGNDPVTATASNWPFGSSVVASIHRSSIFSIPASARFDLAVAMKSLNTSTLLTAADSFARQAVKNPVPVPISRTLCSDSSSSA